MGQYERVSKYVSQICKMKLSHIFVQTELTEEELVLNGNQPISLSGSEYFADNLIATVINSIFAIHKEYILTLIN